MKILLYENRKSDPIAWDVSDLEKEIDAFYSLFLYLKDNWDCYCNMEDEDPANVKFYQKALTGNKVAARRLLHLRRDYEYEFWTLLKVQE